MDKEYVVYTHSEILFKLKKEILPFFGNIDEFEGHHAKRNVRHRRTNTTKRNLKKSNSEKH